MMVDDMRDPDSIWRFGRWLARRRSGEVLLSGSQGDLVLRVARGKIVAAEGPDTGLLGARLGCRAVGREDLFEEAREIAATHDLPETQAVAAAKEILQEALEAWLLDPARGLEIRDTEVCQSDGPTISAAHALVERVLSGQNPAVTRAVLPELDLLLRRADDFLELYAPLRLSEEADLIVAKVTGQRTAREISDRSPHGPDEVLNLLAALVAAGMLEVVPMTESAEQSEPIPVLVPPDVEPARRRLPVWALLAFLATVVVILVLIAVLWQRPGNTTEVPATGGPEWGLVVDMGCEPQELQRVVKKAQQYPNELRPLAAEAGEGSPCWRLVWGRFPDRESASRAIADIPARLRVEGFSPHPIELPPDERNDTTAAGKD
jgi:hypothetical protein